MYESKTLYNSKSGEQKKIDELRQVLNSYLGQKLNKTDKRLLIGIYEDKVEQLSDDAEEECCGISQETVQRQEVFNKSFGTINNSDSHPPFEQKTINERDSLEDILSNLSKNINKSLVANKRQIIPQPER